METRYGFLDGMRGWAALIVMLLHVFFGSFPAIDYSPVRFDLWYAFNGDYMVGLFFCVSGFALSISYLNHGKIRNLLRIATGRYFRLVIPVFATCLLVYLLINFDLLLPPEARLPVYQRHFEFDATLFHLLKFGLFDVFFDYQTINSYAGTLWTMSYELIGSFSVLGLLLIVGRFKWRWVPFLLFSIFLIATGSYYGLFFIGTVCAELYIFLKPYRRRYSKLIDFISVPIIIMGYGVCQDSCRLHSVSR